MNRSSAVGVVVLALVLCAAGVGYVAWASGRVDDDIATREARALESIETFQRDDDAAASAADEPDPEPVEEPEATPIDPGSVVAINRVPGDDYGRVLVMDADGTRTLLDDRCERLHIAASRGICVSREETLAGDTFFTRYLDATDTALREVRAFPSVSPSRARVSPDGSLVSTTGFLSGSSYADVGSESETLAAIDGFESSDSYRVLEQFEVDSFDERYRNTIGQYWGVTFADENRFWVTGFFGDEPEILEGSTVRGLLIPTGLVGSCPSVSPDGSTLVYKRLREDAGFDLVAVDLSSNESWVLGEARSVDDQVEWLDDDTILYALHTDESAEGDASVTQPQFDIWSLDIAEGSEPELFLPAADSPATIR